MLELVGLDQSFFEKCVKFFCEELDINIPELAIFADDTIEANGECYQNSSDEYMILLKDRKKTDMVQTLAHELTHVKQYMKDQLDEKLDLSIPYADRWWEKEAFESEETLMRALIQKVTEGSIKL